MSTLCYLKQLLFFLQDNQENAVIPPDSVITNGISIILALLETRTAVTDINVVNDNNNDYGGNFTPENMATNEISAEDLAKQTAILNNTLNAISPWLGDFTDLLTNPPNLTVMRTTAGVLDPPLGQTRLRKCFDLWIWYRPGQPNWEFGL